MFSAVGKRASRMCLRGFSNTVESSSTSSPKIIRIVDDISSLNLLENAALVTALKQRLNIQDIAMPSFAAASGPSSVVEDMVEEAPVVEEKTSFTIKLQSFEASAKAKMIREIKQLMPGANLVEAKKFVEAVPKVVRENVAKEEAEKIKAVLEGLGGTVLLE